MNPPEVRLCGPSSSSGAVPPRAVSENASAALDAFDAALAAATPLARWRRIMKQTGHRLVTVVRRYIRDAELFDDNAAAGIGL